MSNTNLRALLVEAHKDAIGHLAQIYGCLKDGDYNQAYDFCERMAEFHAQAINEIPAALAEKDALATPVCFLHSRPQPCPVCQTTPLPTERKV